MKKTIVLTGIKPTGMPHLGNYLGAIKPALEMAQNKDVKALFFIADYHSLNSIRDAQTLRSYTYEVAASWLAAGLNPQRVLFYRQSDIPEIFELTSLLMAFTAKGLMNRAHAYKAAVEENRKKNHPDDHQLNMGLYTYPVLMAADILLFDTQLVPVGKDQVQHVEMAQDIAGSVNHNYKQELLVIPRPKTPEKQRNIPGLDGRKMSKSYRNHIPLFLPEKALRQRVNKFITNSQGVVEKKDPDTSVIFSLYRLLASEEECTDLAIRYRAGGMGWGEAKAALFEKINALLAPMRSLYVGLIDDKPGLDSLLADGAQQAREIAAKKIQKLRKAMGLRA